MKKAIITTLIFGALVFFTSCLKEKHTIRFKNAYALTINNVVIGSASFGNVAAGQTSDYKSINTGNFKVSGTASNGAPLTGSGSISGKGKHKWTATLTSAGTMTFEEDK